MGTYSYPRYDYVRPAELDAAAPRRPVAIVGGGMVGLTMALDLAGRGCPVIVFDEDNSVSFGSRSVCHAKRTLEIWDRLGVAAPMMAKGVTWNEARVYSADKMIYGFNLQDQPQAKFPAFINLQQYYCEAFMVERAMREPLIDLRWKHKVSGLTPTPDGVRLTVQTPDGEFAQDCDWLVAADGARSTVRSALGLDFEGQVFADHFLIVDIVMQKQWPSMRRFYFNPPWGREDSMLVHKQPDNVWRLDFQLGRDIDKQAELEDENIIPRVRRLIGPDTPFEIEWKSVYTFQCRSIAQYRHDRILFIGDAAHQVSPFGARGGNGGVQDADNLAWKLALVAQGEADPALLDSFDEERRAAARENIMNSTRSTDFITPKTGVSRIFRDAVLRLAIDHPFARTLVNTGRLSVPKRLRRSSLNGPDELQGELRPGDPAPGLPTGGAAAKGATHLTDLLGDGFSLLAFGEVGALPPSSPSSPLRLLDFTNGLTDPGGAIAGALGARDGGYALVRPDQHLLATWRRFDPAAITRTIDRVLHPAGASA